MRVKGEFFEIRRKRKERRQGECDGGHKKALLKEGLKEKKYSRKLVLNERNHGFGLSEHEIVIDVLPSEASDILDSHFTSFHERSDSLRQRAVVFFGGVSGLFKCVEERWSADEKTCIDGVEIVDFLSDGSDFSVFNEDLCGVVHVEDVIEFVIDAEQCALFWRDGLGSAYEHVGFEDMIGHGEDEVSSDGVFSAEHGDTV